MEQVLTPRAAPLNGKKHQLQENAPPGIITIAALQAQTTLDAAAHTKPALVVPHKTVLTALLEQVRILDFRKVSGLESETEKLKQKHFLITVVEEVLALAKRYHWGLCRNESFLHVYNGAYWSSVPTDDLRAFLQKAAERMGVDKYDARHAEFAKKLIDQFYSAAYLPVPERSLEAVRINLSNGTFYIGADGQKLCPFNQDDFLTHQLPFAYDLTAVAPRFQRFLERVLPDVDCQLIVAEYLGYLFVPTARLKLEKTLLLYGSGANGKSVLFEIVLALLGEDNVSSYSLQSLTVEPALARVNLGNKLLNYASELSGKSDPNVLKQLISGEPVEARLLYKQPFMLTNYAKLAFNCNTLPVEVEHTNAYFRRLLIVPFLATIPEAEQDPKLAANIIATELPGIFNWVLTGLNRLLAQGRFTESKAVGHQVEEYRRSSDSVRSFLDDNGYEASSNHTIPRKMLYPEYRTYCLDEGNRPVNSHNFGKRLESYGIYGARHGGGNVHGLVKRDL
jgi:putative DNA primase/helicase